MTKPITSRIEGVALTTKANVYFDGKCISHSFEAADGSKKTVGVILAATLNFGTGAAELMECVGGSCEYKLAGSDVWVSQSEGDQFSVPANSRFDIRVADNYHYICSFV